MSVDVNHEIFYGVAYNSNTLIKALKECWKSEHRFEQLTFNNPEEFARWHNANKNRTEIVEVAIAAHEESEVRYDTRTGKILNAEVRKIVKSTFWCRPKTKDYTADLLITVFWLYGGNIVDAADVGIQIDSDEYHGLTTSLSWTDHEAICWLASKLVNLYLKSTFPSKYNRRTQIYFKSFAEVGLDEFIYLTTKPCQVDSTESSAFDSFYHHTKVLNKKHITELALVEKCVSRLFNFPRKEIKLIHVVYGS